MTSPRLGTTERGYGAQHKKLRRRWQSQVDRGEVRCFRCQRFIAAKGDPCRRCLRKGKSFAEAVRCRWDLGHDDVDRSFWTGPEHACCNRGTKAHRVEREGRRRALPGWWPLRG